MKLVHFVPCCLIFAGAFGLAQSGRTLIGDQPSVPPAGGTPPRVRGTSSLLPQVTTQEKAWASKPTAPPSGVNFTPPVTYSIGAGGGYGSPSVVAADVNGDGKPDLLAMAGTGVGVLLGNGDGTFQPVVIYSTGLGHLNGLAVADVNGDGKSDLLAGSEFTSGNDGSITVLLGAGDGTFQLASSYSSGGAYAHSLALADVNGDGKPDLIVANGGGAAILLGNGDGTFQTAVTYSSSSTSGGGQSAVVGDVNGDGKPDILVGNQAPSVSDSSTVGVLLGNGDGTFQPVVTYDSGGAMGGVIFSEAIADVNGDGKPDLLIANCTANNVGVGGCSDGTNGNVGVLLGNGDGTFQTVVAYSSGGYYADSVVVADVDGDGKSDLVIVNACQFQNASSCDPNGSVAFLLGNGDGTFHAAVAYPSAAYFPFSGTVADVNGDGKPDLLVYNPCGDVTCTTNGSVEVFINTTTAATAISLVSSQNPSSFAQPVTLTATVTSLGFSQLAPGCTVFVQLFVKPKSPRLDVTLLHCR